MFIDYFDKFFRYIAIGSNTTSDYTDVLKEEEGIKCLSGDSI